MVPNRATHHIFKFIQKDHDCVFKLYHNNFTFLVSINYCIILKWKIKGISINVFYYEKNTVYSIYVLDKNYSGNLDILKDDERDHDICINSFD